MSHVVHQHCSHLVTEQEHNKLTAQFTHNTQYRDLRVIYIMHTKNTLHNIHDVQALEQVRICCRMLFNMHNTAKCKIVQFAAKSDRNTVNI